MSAQNIHPVWTNIQPGDVVTLEIGKYGELGYLAGTYEVIRGANNVLLAGGRSLQYWSESSWELVKITRKQPTMQTHKGALGMSNRGIVVHDGDSSVPFWVMSPGAPAMVCQGFDVDLGEIVPVVPVPLAEYKALQKAAEENNGTDLYHAAHALVSEAVAQWSREGMRDQVKLD